MKEVRTSMVTTMILILLNNALGASATLLLKLGLKNSTYTFSTSTFSIVSDWRVLLGFTIQILSYIVTMALISRLNISYMIPLSSAVGYVFTILGSLLILHEKISVSQWIGITIIFIGIVVMNLNNTTSS